MQQEDFYLRQIQKIGTLIAAMMNKRKEGFAQKSVNLSAIIFKEIVPNAQFEPQFSVDEKELEKLSEETLFLLQKAAYETGKSYHDLGDTQNASDYFQVSLQVCTFAERKSKTYNYEREEMRQNAAKNIENK